MPHITQSVLPGDNRPPLIAGRCTHRRGKRLRHLPHRVRRATGHVAGAEQGLVAEQRHDVHAGHVGNMHEVATLPSVFRHSRRHAPLECAAEDARHTRIRGVARHTGAVDVVVAEPARIDAVLPGERGQEVLLVELGRGIDVARIGRRVLGHGLGRQFAATLIAPRLEGSGVEVLDPTGTRPHDPVVPTSVAAFAVDDHGRGQDGPACEAQLVEDPQSDGPADVVVLHISRRVAEVEPESDLSGLMADGVGTDHGRSPRIGVANVAPDVARALVEVRGPRTVRIG